jgi:Tn3 transposase DDE domain
LKSVLNIEVRLIPFRARHERVLLALESGSLAWFGRILRDYDRVGDLSDEGRRKMPGMMRNADGRHLALTRRQVAKVRKTAEYIVSRGVRPQTAREKVEEVRPVNLAAQLQYTLMIQRVLTEPDWTQRMLPEDLRALTPLIYAHVTPYGTFRLDMNQRLAIEQDAVAA